MNQQSYYAVIPANVRYSKEVSDGAKLLYGEITALSNQNGYCWATNKYFADLYGKSSDTVSRWISELSAAGFIVTLVDSSAANSRKIWLAGSPGVSAKMPTPIGKNASTLSAKMPTPIGKNAEQNNTVNNKLNNTKEEKEKSFSTPEHFALEAEKQKPIPPVAPAPLSIELHDPETPGVTIYDHIPHKGYPTTEPVGEWQRVNIPQEIEALKTDTAMREAFTMSRKIPPANYAEYLEAFSIDVQGRGEKYTTPKQLRSHFLNWSGTRFEIQSRKAKESKPAIPTGQPAKIRQL
jgi:hypothetical protein